jgi:hypothetical protein
MSVTEERLQEFIRLYEEETGEKLEHAEASEIVTRLVDIYELLLSPTPSEIVERKAMPPPSDLPPSSHAL